MDKTSRKEQPINVVYITDNNTVDIMSLSMYSLLYNHANISIKISVIACAISEDRRTRLMDIADKFKADVHLYESSPKLNKMRFPNTKENNCCAYNTLFLASLVDEDKVIYIDCDTIIDGSLEELWKTDIGEKYIAGVMDTTGVIERREAGIIGNDLYINSGVMLCNLKLWRINGLERSFTEYMNDHVGTYIFRNQRVMNAVCKGRIDKLPVKYNMLPEYFRFSAWEIELMHKSTNFYRDEELENAREHPVIVHYAGRQFNRPWYYPCINPMKDLFYQYEELSGISVERKKYKLRLKIRIERFLLDKFNPFVYVIANTVNSRLKEMRMNMYLSD